MISSFLAKEKSSFYCKNTDSSFKKTVCKMLRKEIIPNLVCICQTLCLLLQIITSTGQRSFNALLGESHEWHNLCLITGHVPQTVFCTERCDKKHAFTPLNPESCMLLHSNMKALILAIFSLQRQYVLATDYYRSDYCPFQCV